VKKQKRIRTDAIGVSEHDEAVVFAQWLTLNKVFFLHIANEGKRSFMTASKLKAEGLSAGAADYLVFTRSKKEPEVRGFAVEMKRKGSAGKPAGRATPEQIDFLNRLNAQGWCSAVCWGADDAIAWCVEHGIGK